MVRWILPWLVAALPVAQDGAPGTPQRQVLVASRIVTLDPARPQVEALLIEGERIVHAGTEAECRSRGGAASPVRRVEGTVVPGFTDAHAHLMSGGLAARRLDLSGCRSEVELLDRVQAYVATRPPGEWIHGRGFDQTLFAGGGWPTRRALDDVTHERPAFLERVDGHSALVNTAAMNAAGIDEKTPDPPGGVIERDAEGQPTGILKERAAERVEALIPPPAAAEKRRAIDDVLGALARLGVTSATDHGGDPELWLERARAGALTARVSLWGRLEDPPAAHAAWRERLAPYVSRLELRTVKGYVDGTFGSRTAALHEPYADDPSTRGVLTLEPEWLAAQITAYDAADFQVALHCIGDRAVTVALDAIAAARRANGRGPGEGPRHRLEHVQVARAEDLQRMAVLGVVASIQPCHLLTDRRFATARLGPERTLRSYPWRSLIEAGVPLAFGSDYPVEPLDPRRNLWSATTRRGELGEEAYPGDEVLAPQAALEAQCRGGAFAAGHEDERGRLAAGYLADLVVLDVPAVTPLDPEVLRDAPVTLTMVGGTVVFEAGGN